MVGVTGLSQVKVQGSIASGTRILSVCIDGHCSRPTSLSSTLTFTWTTVPTGTSHTITMTIQGSFSSRGTVYLTGQWYTAAATRFGTITMPPTSMLAVTVT
jgi:hypothetical protein